MPHEPPEFPVKRDGERRQGAERRRNVRMWGTARRVFGYASGLAAIFYCLTTLATFGNNAVHVAVAAQQVTEQVSTVVTKVDHLSERTDTLVTNQGLMASHLAKLDTITLQEQRAIQALTHREHVRLP